MNNIFFDSILFLQKTAYRVLYQGGKFWEYNISDYIWDVNKFEMPISDTYKYRSENVAFYIAAICNSERYVINITKIQKLLYIVYGVYLRVFDERLTDEHPQAWPYGPVFPRTRKRLLKCELSEITKTNIGDIIKTNTEDIKEIENDKRLNMVIEFVLGRYGKWNAGQLSTWSHQPGSPWDKTVNSDGFIWGERISDNFIIEYFKKLVTVNE